MIKNLIYIKISIFAFLLFVPLISYTSGFEMEISDSSSDQKSELPPLPKAKTGNVEEKIYDAGQILDEIDMQIVFDEMLLDKTIISSTYPEIGKVGEQFTFKLITNYQNFINKAEIVISKTDKFYDEEIIDIIPLNLNDETLYKPKQIGDFFYRFKFYDSDGNIDETSALKISFVNTPGEGEEKINHPKDLALQANRVELDLDKSDINVKGGTLTIRGNKSDKVKSMMVSDNQVIDVKGKDFIYQEILSESNNEINIEIITESNEVITLSRDLYIAENDFFYVALGELTIGKTDTSGPALETTKNQEFDEKVFVNGRLAYYLKGKIKGDYLITSKLNTGEEDIDDIISNIDDKDSRRLLRRIDPDRYYPVYADDSSVVEDAPTQGKFYLRIEKDDSSFVWGNFQTNIGGNELARIERGLYGAGLNLETESTTSFGEKKAVLKAFAAEPGTVHIVEEQRGTGGSLYFLRRQDITQGSETVRIEIRDPTTGNILDTQNLQPINDYDINYIQGRIILSHPLPTVASDSHFIRDGGLSGNDVYLVVNYEYTPLFGNLDDIATGGRVESWLGEYVKVGFTGQKENSADSSQELLAADVAIRYDEHTNIKFEHARSKGQGFNTLSSFNGGFNFNDESSSSLKPANAYRISGVTDGESFGFGNNFKTSYYYELLEKNFSAQNQITDNFTQNWGFKTEINTDENLKITAQHDHQIIRNINNKSVTTIDAINKINKNFAFGIGVEHKKQQNGRASNSVNNNVIQGKRTDVALNLEYTEDNDVWSIFTFVQATALRSEGINKNNRIGVGGSYKAFEKLDLSGEISYGSTGFGAKTELGYNHNENSTSYISYQLDSDNGSFDAIPSSTSQIGISQGTLAIGNRTKYNEKLSVYGEERLGHNKRSLNDLTHAYGLDYRINEAWNWGFGIENGKVNMDTTEVLDRTAATVTIGYEKEGVNYSTVYEIRDEDGANNSYVTHLIKNSLNYKVNPEWQGFLKANTAFTDSENDSFTEGDFVEATVGFAYRPIENDDFNLISKYTYFYDLPSTGQVTQTGSFADYKQKSHIGSIDFIYGLTEKLDVGAKYGLKIAEITESRESDIFFKAITHLGILRADYHLVKKWDILGEVHLLRSEEARDQNLGGLIGIYYHIGDNIKVGGGYNFSNFDTDLTNLSYDAEGWYINILSKF